MKNSDKTLVTTTELIAPTKLKEFALVVSQDAQVKNLANLNIKLISRENKLAYSVAKIGRIDVGSFSDFTYRMEKNQTAITTNSLQNNEIIYIPERTDSFVTGNELIGKSLQINGREIFNGTNGFIDPKIEIKRSAEKVAGYTTRRVYRNNKVVGKFLIHRNDKYIVNLGTGATSIDNKGYETMVTYAEGTTNGIQGVGIIDLGSSFPIDGKAYKSVEDASNPEFNV